MFKGIAHITIVPSNLTRTLNFYTKILGFKIKQRRKPENALVEEIAYIELNGLVIQFSSVKAPAPVSTEQWQVGYRRIALEVEDVDKAVEYLKSRGVEISAEPVTGTNFRRAEIKDPDGLPIELIKKV